MSANANVFAGANMTLGPAGAAVGSTAKNYAIGTAFNFTVDGRIYSKATVANGVTPVVNSEGRPFIGVKPNQRCVFVFGVDKTGAVAVAQGEVIDGAAMAETAATAGQYPTLPKTHTPYAAYMVSADPTAAGVWSMGVSNFTGVTGVTTTIENLACFPAEPMYV